VEANEFKETFEPVILSYKIALDKLYKTKDSNYSCGIPIRIFCIRLLLLVKANQ
jgi:hypothetical protein